MTSQARGRSTPSRRGSKPVPAGLLVLLLLAAVACEDDTLAPPGHPAYAIAALEGYLRAGGEAVVAEIRAEPIHRSGGAGVETWSDSTGWYHLDVAADTYRLRIQMESGWTLPTGYQDTIRVDAGAHRLDLLQGKLTVRVSVPEFLDGHSFDCHAHGMTPQARATSVSAVAVNGSVEFTAPMIAPGVYVFEVRVDDGANCWLPAAANEYTAQQVVVGVSRPRIYEAALEQAAAISGRVRGSWQRAEGEIPTIEAQSLAGWSMGRARPAHDGSFTLGILRPEPVRLRVLLSGIEQWVGGDSAAVATLFTPRPGEHVTGVDFVESGLVCMLQGPGFLSTHRPSVRLVDAAGRPREVYTGNANPFWIGNLRPGRYFLFVYGTCAYERQTWAPQWYDGADSLGAATAIDLPEGTLVPITMHLVPGGSIGVRLRNADGTPASEHLLGIFDRYGTALCESWRSSVRDSLRFTGLADGDYTLAVNFDFGHWWYPGTTSLDSAEVVPIRNHAQVSGIEWRLPAERPAGGEP